MTEITLYGFAPSTFTWSARLALEEKGVPYSLEPVELGSEAHRALHPFSRIPILRHGDTTLFETSAIMRYVDAAFDGPALVPSDPRLAARMEQWISAYNDYFVRTILHGVLYQRVIVPMRGGVTDEAAVAEIMPAVREQLRIADAALADSQYLAGATVTLADLMTVPSFAHLGGVPEGQGLLDGFPNLGRWFAAMCARHSFAATRPAPPQQAAA